VSRTTSSAIAARPLPRLLRALRHRNFALFIGGQLISLVGTWLQSVAQSWLVYRLTGSSLLLGLAGFCGQIPIFLLAPLGGAVADRQNRRSLLVATQTSSMLLAFALGALTLAGRVTVNDVFILASLLGVVNAFDIPARQAFVVEMVEREDLPNAIALNSSIFNMARILGPAVAGVLVAAVGEGWCFVLNGVSFIAVIAGLLMMQLRAAARRDAPGTAFSYIVDGFRFAHGTRPIRALLLLLALVSLVGMPYSVLMPIFADRILHGGARGLGLLMGATGIGALAAAGLLAFRASARGLGRWVAFSAAGFGLSLILFSQSRWFWLSATLLVVTGFCMVLQMAASNTLLQTLSPDALRGRVMSIYSMMFMGMAPIGALLAGAAANHVGAPATLSAGGVLSILGAMVFAARLPGLRDEARALIASHELAGGEPADEVIGAPAR